MLPDASHLALGSFWTSYYFFQQVGIGGAYATGILAFAWGAAFHALRRGSWVWLAVGAAAFSALGMAIVSVIPNSEAATAIANGTNLPVLFISDVFVRLNDPPRWLAVVGDIFPVKHFSQACQTAFNPFYGGSGFEWADLGVIALWGLAGLFVALRYFSWEPKA